MNELTLEQQESVARIWNALIDFIEEVKEVVLRIWENVKECLKSLKPYVDRIERYYITKNLLEAGVKPKSIKYTKIRKGTIL